MIFHSHGTLIEFRIATDEVAPGDVGKLDVVTVVPQILGVQHVIARLVFRIDRRRIEGIHNIHGRKNQSVSPAQRLPPKTDHSLVAGVADRESIEALQRDELAVVVERVRQIEKAAIVIRQAVALPSRQQRCRIDAITVPCEQLVGGIE